jgi:hypothetical protein
MFLYNMFNGSGVGDGGDPLVVELGQGTQLGNINKLCETKQVVNYCDKCSKLALTQCAAQCSYYLHYVRGKKKNHIQFK